MDEEKTLAEKYIEDLPLNGNISLTFIQVTPKIKSIRRKIPLKYLSSVYKQMHHDLENAGISLRINPPMIELTDYYRFMCKLFPEFDVHDCQKDSGVGKPDFVLINKETQFYIELKNGNDGIRHTQMQWLADNKDKEVWYMFVGNLTIEGYNGKTFYYEGD